MNELKCIINNYIDREEFDRYKDEVAKAYYTKEDIEDIKAKANAKFREYFEYLFNIIKILYWSTGILFILVIGMFIYIAF